MLFSSILFLFIFLPGVLIIYYGILKQRASRNHFLLLVSLFFYGWGALQYVLLMIGSIIVNFIAGILINRYKEKNLKAKIVLISMIIFNLALLGVFKYLNFIVENLNKIKGVNFSLPPIALPLGISFFTFQAMSYAIDVYRGRGKALTNPLDVGLYITFFPQLIAGPIVRYETVATAIYTRQETQKSFAQGIQRFTWGLSKKVLLANNFALIADKAFSLSTGELSVALAWMGAVAYMLQIYFDFSGYSDMAIGLGKMFGFHFAENFNAPYLAKSISEFWRRWHISLGLWFKDYVYFPLGGSKVKSRMMLIRNLFIVWFLTGIWHGANWTFILWGLYFFCFIAVEKLFDLQAYFQSKKVIGHFYVIGVVLLGWVLFRADNVSYAVGYIQAMFGLMSNIFIGNLASLYWAENKVLFCIGIMCCLPIQKGLKGKNIKPIYAMKYIEGMMAFLLLITAVAYLVKGTYNPFIYFNF